MRELIRAERGVYRAVRHRADAAGRARGGSWPGYVFTGEPLKLAAGTSAWATAMRAHAPDEYYLIESNNPKVSGIDGAVQIVRGLSVRARVSLEGLRAADGEQH